MVTAKITHPRIKKISPQFLVSDIDRSIEFYTKTLGFDVEFRYEDFYASVINEGYSIHLKTSESLKDEGVIKRNQDDLDILFSVDGIDELYEQLLNKSVELVQSLRLMPYGKEFYISDPDGHIIAFVEETL